METIYIELRAGTGGLDSSLLVQELTDIYSKSCQVYGFSFSLKQWSEGFAKIAISGNGAKHFFDQESGSHQFQRTPPTEVRGRVHTSIVTVAVMSDDVGRQLFKLNRDDVEMLFTKGSGKGGQKRNKTTNVCCLFHRPSGIRIRIEDERSKTANEKVAWEELERRLSEQHQSSYMQNKNQDRSGQIGNGNRGSKRRIYRFQDGFVKDIVSKNQISVKELYKGFIGKLHIN